MSESKSEHKNMGRILKIIIIAAAVILTAAVIIIGIPSGKKKSISLRYSPKDGGAWVFCGDRINSDVIVGDSIANVKYSGGEASAAALIANGSSYSLYGIGGGGFREIDKNATNSFLISYSGKTIVYTDASGALFTCSTNGGNSKKIDESAVDFSVSPDGADILYLKDENNTKKLYLYNKGKSSCIAYGYTPLAVSDGAEFIYALSADNALCVLNADGTMKAKLSSAASADKMYFSSDMKSVVFSDEAYSYVSHEGRSRVRLIPGKASPTGNSTVFCSTTGISEVVGDDDLSELFYVAENSDNSEVLFYITDTDECVSVSDSVSDFTVTGSDAAVYLSSQGSVYDFDGKDSSLIASGVSEMCATDNGRYIYCINLSGGLAVYSRGNNTSIASGVSKMCMTGKNKLLFTLSDNSLYSVSGDTRSDKLDDNVSDFYVYRDAVFYQKNYNPQTGDGEYYVSDGSVKFKKVTILP